jgi:histone H3/H4
MNNSTESSTNPELHVANLRRMLGDVAQHAREDAERVQEPKAQALFETTAEVLHGLTIAYEHYAGKSEAAWR